MNKKQIKNTLINKISKSIGYIDYEIDLEVRIKNGSSVEYSKGLFYEKEIIVVLNKFTVQKGARFIEILNHPNSTSLAFNKISDKMLQEIADVFSGLVVQKLINKVEV